MSIAFGSACTVAFWALLTLVKGTAEQPFWMTVVYWAGVWSAAFAFGVLGAKLFGRRDY